MLDDIYNITHSGQTTLDINEIHETLSSLPENTNIFKCHECRHIFDISRYDKNKLDTANSEDCTICPICDSENIELMCKVDCYSVFLKEKGIVDCRKEEVIPKVDICPVCGSNMCPICFNHNCISLSRVTGYIQDVSGWNVGKKRELLDRKRYTIEGVHMV